MTKMKNRNSHRYPSEEQRQRLKKRRATMRKLQAQKRQRIKVTVKQDRLKTRTLAKITAPNRVKNSRLKVIIVTANQANRLRGRKMSKIVQA